MMEIGKKRGIFGDPLSLIAIGVLFFGILLLLYGLVPFRQANYLLIPGSSGTVPVIDPITGNYVLNPEDYFRQHYSGSIPPDNVQCAPAGSFWQCFGYQFAGTIINYSYPSRYYGLAMVVLGSIGIYAAKRFAPVEDDGPHFRPIRIRVDEDICVANGICVNIAPEVFQFRKQSTPTIFAPLVYVVNSAGADNDTIITAAQMCPTGAIIIEDAETGERIHPRPPKT